MINSTTRWPIIRVVAYGLPDTWVGITKASATRRPFRPITRNSGSTTECVNRCEGSPIRQVPTGALAVIVKYLAKHSLYLLIFIKSLSHSVGFPKAYTLKPPRPPYWSSIWDQLGARRTGLEVELVRVGTIKVDVSHCSREFFREHRVWLVAYKITKDGSSSKDDIKASIRSSFKAPTPDIVKKKMNTTTVIFEGLEPKFKYKLGIVLEDDHGYIDWDDIYLDTNLTSVVSELVMTTSSTVNSSFNYLNEELTVEEVVITSSETTLITVVVFIFFFTISGVGALNELLIEALMSSLLLEPSLVIL
ncbi:unnamed protein product [Oppiella nova]|uniref:Uncharacterized protein n=1 Tax=Oppiella nova TaxID=334625 RepID=A0A7R9MAC3_9ACAR|nr:unnamed protein product [Oppiella nova]CAG2173203.1 unnamed protein product [Oppiella nova]